MDPSDLLLAASAAHAGFQAVISAVVYPALREAPPAGWEGTHERHSHRISYVVGPLYLVVAGACLAVLLDGPGAAALVAVGGNAVACLTTALLAAPLHGQLGRTTSPDDLTRRTALLTRLVRVDLLRTAAALVALAAALLA